MSESTGDERSFKSWTGYFDMRARDNTVRSLLTQTLDLMEAAGRAVGSAIDLGCGEGTDTAELLRRGWKVLALDASEEGIERTNARAAAAGLGEFLETRIAPFEDLEELPPADLLYAGVSLPFCTPGHFPHLWQLIREAVGEKQGWIAVQFFGPNDTWATNPDMTFHTRDEVTELFDGLDIRSFEERDEDGQSAGGPKHWHIFDVIAAPAL